MNEDDAGMGEIFWPAQTDTGAHPASCKMGTGPFLGGKAMECGFDHPPPSNAEIKEKVQLQVYSPSATSLPVLLWNLTCDTGIICRKIKERYS
jgi:hypothetical protein